MTPDEKPIDTSVPLSDLKGRVEDLEKELGKLGFTGQDKVETELQRKLREDEEVIKINTDKEIRSNRARGFDTVLELFNAYKHGLPLTKDYVAVKLISTNLVTFGNGADKAKEELASILNDVIINEDFKQSYEAFKNLVLEALPSDYRNMETYTRKSLEFSEKLFKREIEAQKKRNMDKEKIKNLGLGKGTKKRKKK